MNKDKLCLTGAYVSDYPRNKVLIDALKNEFVVLELNYYKQKFKQIKFLINLFKYRSESRIVFIMQPSQNFSFSIFIYKIFFKNKIVFDTFYSIHDYYVNDRKIIRKKSLKAKYYYLQDWLACRMAEVLIFDTFEHKKYFISKYNVKNNIKKLVIPVIEDIDFFDSIKDNGKLDKIYKKNKFNIFFYGNYIPLQGIEYIIEAANILKDKKDFQFILVGSGQTREKIDNLYKKLNLSNIIFIDRIPYDKLVLHIKKADVCLGIFGNTEKAKRVIPNKVLDYMANRRITITGRNKEKEIYFKDGEDLIYCNMADAKDLADKIFYVYKNIDTLKKIEENGRKKVKKYFSKDSLIKLVKEI